MKKQNLEMAGAPFAFYYSESSVSFDFDAAVAVNKPGKADGLVQPGVVKEGNALLVKFFGPYEKTADAHTLIHEYIGTHNKNNRRTMGGLHNGSGDGKGHHEMGN